MGENIIMKNFKLLTTALLTLSSLLLASDADIKAKIEQLPMIKSIGAKVNKITLLNGIYHIQADVKGKNGGLLEGFLTPDFKTLMIGQAYNLQTGQEIVVPFDLDLKALRNVAAYKMGSGKKEYFIFTDPECPYCQRFEQQLHELKSDVTLYTILCPLDFHKNAISMSRYILSQKDDKAKAAAMKAIAHKSNAYINAKHSDIEKEKYDKIIENSINIVIALGINGTPTILNAKGEKISPQEILKK